jgi:hypothetical protein
MTSSELIRSPRRLLDETADLGPAHLPRELLSGCMDRIGRR